MTKLDRSDIIDRYAAGPDELRVAVGGMSREQFDATPVPGKWSTRQVICHLADFEAIYADRMKHVIAVDRPSLAGDFHEQFAAHLAYDGRDIEEELELIEVVRCQMVRILRTLPAPAFERTGVHSVEGEISLAKLLERITGHIPHHIRFIEEKRRRIEAETG